MVTRKTGTDGVARTSWTVGSPGAQILRATAGSLNVDISANAVSCNEIALAVGEVRSLSQQDAACTVLNGSAQRYLITLVNPTNSPIASIAYKARGVGGPPPAQIVGAVTPSAAVPKSSSSSDEAMDESLARARMHALILEKNMERLQHFSPQTRAALQSTIHAASPAPPPTVGDIIPMKLPNIAVNECTSFIPLQTRVVYVGTKGIILEDIANPLAGQIDTLYKRIGQNFDNVTFPILNANFGNPLVMDSQLNNDGAMYMVFSTKVNTLGNGLILGFVSNADFFPAAQCPSSNVAEVFYSRAPTVLGGGTTEPTANWEIARAIESTMIHEAKHATSFANKISQPGFSGNQPAEDGWLEESSAEIAQELLSRVTFSYKAKSNVDFAATLAKEVRPSTGMPQNMFNAFNWLYKYLSDSENRSLVGSAAPGDVTFYGSGWGFLRWAIDTYATSESAFLTAMTRDVSHFGVKNIENLTGKPFQELLSEYSLALVLDDYPGFTPTDARYSFPSWNLRSMFAGMSGDFSISFPNQVPVKPRASGFGNFNVQVGGVRGGGFSVLELSGTQANKQLLEFKNGSGTAFLTGMRVNIVRVQ
jgi:hypothetical protein